MSLMLSIVQDCVVKSEEAKATSGSQGRTERPRVGTEPSRQDSLAARVRANSFRSIDPSHLINPTS